MTISQVYRRGSEMRDCNINLVPDYQINDNFKLRHNVDDYATEIQNNYLVNCISVRATKYVTYELVFDALQFIDEEYTFSTFNTSDVIDVLSNECQVYGINDLCELELIISEFCNLRDDGYWKFNK